MKSKFFYLSVLFLVMLSSCYYKRHVFHYNILLYDGENNHILELDRLKEFNVNLIDLYSNPISPSNYTYNIFSTEWSGTPLYRIVFDIEKYNGRGSLNKYEVWAEKEGKDLIAKIEDKKGVYKTEEIYLSKEDRYSDLIVKLKKK